MIISVLLLNFLFFLFQLDILLLEIAIVEHKIFVKCIHTWQFPFTLKIFQSSNLLQKLLFLLPFNFMTHFVHLHLLSHLAKMLLHYLITGQFAVVVNFLAELYDVCWVDLLFEGFVTKISNSFESHWKRLRIWVGHMKRSGLFKWHVMALRPCLSNWWWQYTLCERQVIWVSWHGGVSGLSISFLRTVLCEWLPF